MTNDRHYTLECNWCKKNTMIKIIHRLDIIIQLLEEMKQQEKEYWETWKQAKANEVKEE